MGTAIARFAESQTENSITIAPGLYTTVAPGRALLDSLITRTINLIRLATVQQSGLPELISFARGVELDKAAVHAGLTLPINNGQVEGHVTRIKLDPRA